MTDRLETEADPEDDRKPLNPHKYIISLALTVCIGLILHEFITTGTWNGDNTTTALFNIRPQRELPASCITTPGDSRKYARPGRKGPPRQKTPQKRTEQLSYPAELGQLIGGPC